MRRMSTDTAAPLPDGLVAVVKRDCPTCVLVAPVLADLAERAAMTTVSQDDAAFPSAADWVIHDADLAMSWHNDIETVPTVLRVVDGIPTERIEGWRRNEWEEFTGVGELGPGLPDWRPGCGSLSVDPTIADDLLVRFSGSSLGSRRIELAALEDQWEAMWDRGWSDGLPVVPPTEARVMRMLEGTSRAPDEIVAVVPPDLVPCTVEKVAINAVMAGCRPDYLPVVLAAVEAEGGLPPVLTREEKLGHGVAEQGIDPKGLVHPRRHRRQRVALQQPQDPDILPRALAAAGVCGAVGDAPPPCDRGAEARAAPVADAHRAGRDGRAAAGQQPAAASEGQRRQL